MHEYSFRVLCIAAYVFIQISPEVFYDAQLLISITDAPQLILVCDGQSEAGSLDPTCWRWVDSLWSAPARKMADWDAYKERPPPSHWVKLRQVSVLTYTTLVYTDTRTEHTAK